MTDKEIEVIVKSIFTKMFKANFSACEYGIECYRKGMEYQGIKELATENDNLIKRVRKLEQQIEKMKSDVTDEIGFAKNFNELHTYSVLNNLLNKWEIKENE